MTVFPRTFTSFHIFKSLAINSGCMSFPLFYKLTPCPLSFQERGSSLSRNELSPLSEREGTKG